MSVHLFYANPGIGAAYSGGPSNSPPPPSSVWPLSIHASGRYLVQNDGTPFLLIGDTVWSLVAQCTTAQIDSYLNDRAAKGCKAVLFSAPEYYYTAQTPRYRNVAGDDPFTVMSPVNWVLNDAYWHVVDYAVNGCKSRGMAAIINPAYWGQSGDGWYAELSATSDAVLQAYGEALANRYTQGNVIWCLGGDESRTAGDRTKQWQIALGMRNVRTTDLITAHTARLQAVDDGVNGEAYRAWGGGSYAGFNLNNIYLRDSTDDGGPTMGANAYGRTPALPFFMIEAGYEAGTAMGLSDIVPTIRCMLAGGLAGGLGGHDVLWHMGTFAPDDIGTANALSTYLAGSWDEMGYFATLMASYQWWKLEPKTDASLVTTSLGTGASRISPARASDGSFAMIHTPAQNFTVAMSALAPSSVRARWWNWADGTFTTAAGSPFPNTGTQAFAAPGDRILVLDGA